MTSDRLSKKEIWEIVDEFRNHYIHNEDIPVDIELIVNSAIGIQIIPLPGLQNDCDMVGFISLDFKFIYVDEDLYYSDIHYNRVRFTIAHEIGHYILHRSKIDSFAFQTIEEWKEFRLEIKIDTNGWFEYQANEFGGRLLVPINQLVKEVKRHRAAVLNNLSWSKSLSNEELTSLLAPRISPSFGVSDEVIEKRLARDLVYTLLQIGIN